MLEPVYDEYVRDVSDPIWGMSLETATYLYSLCRATKPTRVLDTGSGFSSYVLRRYAREAGHVTVVSADDDAQWLERTATFLRQRDLTDDGLVLWPSAQVAEGRYDVVFHDLASGGARVESIPLVLSAVTRGGGAVLFDDAHHYGGEIFAEGRSAGFELYSVRSFTLDRFGRYAVLGIA
jgi:predicted O-methyltransferase YrrM